MTMATTDAFTSFVSHNASLEEVIENRTLIQKDIMEIPSYCLNISNPTTHDKELGDLRQQLIFWVEGVVLSLTAVVGIIGNMLTCVVLHRISLDNVFNQLIVALSTVDSVFAAICVVEYSLRKGFKWITWTTFYMTIWPKIILPMQNIAYSMSLFVTLAIAIERYMAICHPFLVQRSRKPSTFHTVVHQTTEPNLYNKDTIDCHARISDTAQKCDWLKKMGSCFKSSRSGNNNSGMTLKKRTCHYLLPVLIFSILLNIPKFMEFETYIIPNTNITSVKPTDMFLSQAYELYYNKLFRGISQAFMPFLLMSFLNGRIIHKMTEYKRITSTRTYSSSQKREAKLARILVTLVFCFLFCNLGKIVLSIYDLGNSGKMRNCLDLHLQLRLPSWVIAMTSFTHLFLVMNASANLILISATGTQFRDTLLAMLRLRKPRNTSSTANNTCSHHQGNDKFNKFGSTTDMTSVTQVTKHVTIREHDMVSKMPRGSLTDFNNVPRANHQTLKLDVPTNVRLSRPLSENQINLIENTPPQQQREKRCTEFGKSGLSNLLRPKCPTKCGNISETSSLIVKGELFTAASQEGIEMESTSESTKI